MKNNYLSNLALFKLIKKNISLRDIKLGDIIVLILAIIFILFLFKYYWFTKQNSVEFVSIQISNQQPQIYPVLSQQKIKIKADSGESEIEINNGKVRFSHSTCRSQQCVIHGWIGQAGETLVCLPNKISVQLIGRDADFDALSF